MWSLSDGVREEMEAAAGVQLQIWGRDRDWIWRSRRRDVDLPSAYLLPREEEMLGLAGSARWK